MDFTNVKEWTIAEGSVINVTDSLGRVIWEKQQPTPVSNDYFYIEDISGQNNTLSIVKNNTSAPTIEVFKSTDGTNWASMGTTDTTAIEATIPANGKLYLKATANTWSNNDYNNNITVNGNHNVGGNIMSLIYGDNFIGKTSFPSGSSYNFNKLFHNNRYLISANDLALPATTLTEGCYRSMFKNCNSLTSAPALPATTLVQSCYASMFENTSLTTAPVLPATTLARSCYYYMFGYCYSLTTAPVLPATTLANYCYCNMFDSCRRLNKVTTYAADISASNCLNNWLYDVSSTGDFYNLGGATYPTDSASGIPTGWTEHTSL